MFKFLSKSAGLVGYVIQYGCLTHCTFEYLGDFVVCSGPSMEPTLHSHNILITERLTPRFQKFERGDIIIAKSPTNPTQHICKRIIGLPGDRILTRPSINFNPFDNSNRIHTSFKKEDGAETMEEDFARKPKKNEIIVPRGHVWIEGDNPENSADSRYYGPIPLGLIRSRAVCRLWPLSEIKMLN